MVEFTKEQLIEHARECVEHAEKFSDIDEAMMDKALYETALAALMAEPVYQCEFCHMDAAGEAQWRWEDVNKDFYDQYESERRGKRRIIYTAPPAAVVPEEMTPEMMQAVQLNTELGSYAAANLSGAYGLFSEFWKEAYRAATKPKDGK